MASVMYHTLSGKKKTAASACVFGSLVRRSGRSAGTHGCWIDARIEVRRGPNSLLSQTPVNYRYARGTMGREMYFTRYTGPKRVTKCLKDAWLW